MKQEKYKEILSKNLLPFASTHYKRANKFIFQQENCRTHKAKTIVSCLDASNIKLTDWLAQSADINPIESARVHLK